MKRKTGILPYSVHCVGGGGGGDPCRNSSERKVYSTPVAAVHLRRGTSGGYGVVYFTTATIFFSFSATVGTEPGLLCFFTFLSLAEEKQIPLVPFSYERGSVSTGTPPNTRCSRQPRSDRRWTDEEQMDPTHQHLKPQTRLWTLHAKRKRFGNL